MLIHTTLSQNQGIFSWLIWSVSHLICHRRRRRSYLGVMSAKLLRFVSAAKGSDILRWFHWWFHQTDFDHQPAIWEASVDIKPSETDIFNTICCRKFWMFWLNGLDFHLCWKKQDPQLKPCWSIVGRYATIMKTALNKTTFFERDSVRRIPYRVPEWLECESRTPNLPSW